MSKPVINSQGRAVSYWNTIKEHMPQDVVAQLNYESENQRLEFIYGCQTAFMSSEPEFLDGTDWDGVIVVVWKPSALRKRSFPPGTLFDLKTSSHLPNHSPSDRPALNVSIPGVQGADGYWYPAY